MTSALIAGIGLAVLLTLAFLCIVMVATYISKLLRVGIMRLFFRKNGAEALFDEHERNRQKVIMEAFRTGKAVYGTYDENGVFVMKTFEKDNADEG